MAQRTTDGGMNEDERSQRTVASPGRVGRLASVGGGTLPGSVTRLGQQYRRDPAAGTATAMQAGNPDARRYCVQPVQPMRKFDPSVAPGRLSAIMAVGKTWVNGTQI